MRIFFEDVVFAPKSDRVTCNVAYWVQTGAAVEQDLWFRFSDNAADATLYDINVFATRSEASAVPLNTSTRLAYLEGRPKDRTRNHSDTLTEAIPSMAGLTLGFRNELLPTPWCGCVWGYHQPNAEVTLDGVVNTLSLHTGSGQSLDGVAVVRHDPDDAPGPLPSIGVKCESVDFAPTVEMYEGRSRWRWSYGIAVRIQVPQLGAWWRSCAQYAAAVRSILADEYARGIAGVVTMLPAGGDPLRDGVSMLRFSAEVAGTFE